MNPARYEYAQIFPRLAAACIAYYYRGVLMQPYTIIRKREKK